VATIAGRLDDARLFFLKRKNHGPHGWPLAVARRRGTGSAGDTVGVDSLAFLSFPQSVPCGHSIPRPPIASNHPRFRRKRGVAPNNGVHLWPVMGAKDPWRRVITLAPCNSPIWLKKAVRDPSGRPNVVTSGPRVITYLS